MRKTTFIVVAVFAFGLAGCASQQPIPEIAEVEYSQSKAVPDFDGGPWTEQDPARLSDLQEVLTENDWTPGWKDDSGECDGGTFTSITLTFVDGKSAPIDFTSCADAGEFEEDVMYLIDEWKDD